MSNNYIKIELINSNPYISMEYEDLESFKDLVFFMISQSGANLFCKTIEQELLLADKKEELKLLEFMYKILQTPEDELLISSNDSILMNPSSFN